MATNDRKSAEDAICALCGQTYGQHAGTALTDKNDKGWRWGKSACPVGASPFHPTQTFNAGGAVVDAPAQPDWEWWFDRTPEDRIALIKKMRAGKKEE